MNKQEFYEIAGTDYFLPVNVIAYSEGACHVQLHTLERMIDLVVPEIYKLKRPSQPQKVIVPKFVADWLEWSKENGLTLSEALSAKENKEVNEWFTDNREDLFARAWLDGYEVEQEKLYTVEIPNSKEYPIILVKDLVAEDVYMIPKRHIKMGPEDYGSLNNYLTESEIRKDFDWAWQAGFAKEVE